MKYKHKRLTKDEVIGLISVDDQAPLWINISVIKATNGATVIGLLTIRRLGREADFIIRKDFHRFTFAVPLPPGHQAGMKFDVNWQRHDKEYRTLWSRLKSAVGFERSRN